MTEELSFWDNIGGSSQLNKTKINKQFKFLIPMIITISGKAGSGKSTIAQKLQEILHAERIYVGGLRREIARKKGMSLEQLNEYAKTHPETDVEVDEEVAAQARALATSGKNVIVEGRTQFHFLPESIKLFITVDIDEASRRVWKDLQENGTKEKRNEGDFQSIQELKKSILERDRNDTLRYLKYYGFDHLDQKHFDLVVDTTKMKPEEVMGKILQYLQKRKV